MIYTSHYMEEVERLCSRIMIMDHGRSVASGSADELKGMIGTGEKISIEVGSMDETTLEQLRSLELVRRAEMADGMLRVQCAAGAHNLQDILAVLAGAHIAYGRVLSEPPTLNDVFLEICGRELRDEA